MRSWSSPAGSSAAIIRPSIEMTAEAWMSADVEFNWERMLVSVSSLITFPFVVSAGAGYSAPP